MEWRMIPPVAPPAEVLPVVRNVRFVNVSGNVNYLGMIHGLKDSPINDVKLKRYKVSAQKGLTVDNVRDFDYSGFWAEVKEGQIIINKYELKNYFFQIFKCAEIIFFSALLFNNKPFCLDNFRSD